MTENQEPRMSDITGVGDSTGERLRAHGIDTVAQIAALDTDQLSALPGFGPLRAKAVRQSAIDLLNGARSATDEGEPVAHIDIGPDEDDLETVPGTEKKKKKKEKHRSKDEAAKRKNKGGKKEKKKDRKSGKLKKNKQGKKGKKEKKGRKNKKRRKGGKSGK